MKKVIWVLMCFAAVSGSLQAQETFVGSASVGSNEPLYSYDDQEPWKHGYLQIMPYYHGWHSFRPYNYHHIFNQSQTASGWGMSPVMPYSQQFWHKYENQADLSQGHHSLVTPNIAPLQEDSHYPTPIGPTTTNPTPALPQMQQMQYQVPAHNYQSQVPAQQYYQPQYQATPVKQGPVLRVNNTQLQGYLNQGQLR